MKEPFLSLSSFTQCAVIKYGGHVMGESENSFPNLIVSLYRKKIAPIVVHGGGPEITKMLKRLDIQSEFVNGLRKTTEESLEVVQMVLCGLVNKRLAALIGDAGIPAIGISGMDGQLMQAESFDADLGLVGNPSAFNPAIIQMILKGGMIPVIAPIASDKTGQVYNINADTVAAFIAASLGTNLFILTDVPGVRNHAGEIAHRLNEKEIQALYQAEIIQDGMYPKVQACLESLKSGAQKAIILDGRMPQNVERILISGETGIGTHICLD